MFKTVLTAVQDLDAARATWSVLLGEPTNDSPYYVGWTFEDHEVGLMPTANQQELTGPTPYWHPDTVVVSGRRPSRTRTPTCSLALARLDPLVTLRVAT